MEKNKFRLGFKRKVLIKKIGIINSGTGNLLSVINSFKKFDICIKKVENEKIEKFDAIILPGVGSFESVMKNLKSKGQLSALNSYAIKLKKPILGICLGMHLMMEESEEANGICKGFGWFKGRVKENTKYDQKILNVGWNKIHPTEKIKNLRLKKILREEYYFDHSYSLTKESEGIIANIRKKKIPALIAKKNLMGVQFHPEKSQKSGLEVIKFFLSKFKLIN